MEVEGKARGVPGMDLIKKVGGHPIYVGAMGTCGERALVQLLTSPRPLPRLVYYPGGQPGPGVDALLLTGGRALKCNKIVAEHSFR